MSLHYCLVEAAHSGLKGHMSTRAKKLLCRMLQYVHVIDKCNPIIVENLSCIILALASA